MEQFFSTEGLLWEVVVSWKRYTGNLWANVNCRELQCNKKQNIIYADAFENVLLVPSFLFQLLCLSVRVSKCHHSAPTWGFFAIPAEFITQKMGRCEGREIRRGGHRRSYLTLHQCVIAAAAAAGLHDWMSPVADAGGGGTQRK